MREASRILQYLFCIAFFMNPSDFRVIAADGLNPCPTDWITVKQNVTHFNVSNELQSESLRCPSDAPASVANSASA